ncbi:hypothetical protein BKA65DRAFT_473311 [Rhexocercosporidium sp. MPI-PUGE-AT-0058]|nr:hypothetical protein BKA65DRAFT_473311 [Rhexocercosporidium sp. MPI-PUGE-AT-0058]
MTSEHAEDELSLLNEERKVPRSSDDRIWRTWLIPTACLILGFVMGALFHSDTMSRSMSTSTTGTHANTQSEQVVNGSFDLGERFPWTERKIFWPDPEFKKEQANETDASWEDLMPLGKGSVAIDWNGDPMIYNGSPTNLTQTKVVSAFHQMHCLNLIRRSFAVSISSPNTFPYLIGQLLPHWDNCFEYLRQVLMCMADTTLEELERDDRGEAVAHVDGWGTERVCRSWEGVRGWAQGHRGGGRGSLIEMIMGGSGWGGREGGR